MFLEILHNQSGESLVLRRLGPNESIDVRFHVIKWADESDIGTPSFSESGAHIANGCGDYQAEIRRTKAATGSCWDSEPFFLE